jgi:hypothetical protein
MTDETAERLADLALGTLMAAGALYVLKTPARRRFAWQLAVAGLTRSLPGWFRQEIIQAWHESGRSVPHALPASPSTSSSISSAQL